MQANKDIDFEHKDKLLYRYFIDACFVNMQRDRPEIVWHYIV